ncbi:MAG: 30S ribosomal protein S12 methylthiotransferase RimO [Clostridia bacterium]|nr:30S ribosomal protein S12 methylthiotransferase RimO [Clostridia bacterium]
MSKIAMIGLGCPKNQVDAEVMLSLLIEAGFEITGDTEDADLVIVNTCGFINDAKKEAIDTILSACEMKKEGIIRKVVVTGCLSERYKDEIMKEIPEVDGCVGIGANGEIAEICKRVLEGEKLAEFPSKYNLSLDGDRVLTAPSHYAYLKIAEGCSNCCTYCAIPKIRGKFRSRTFASVVLEASELAKNGVKELILVAQDTTKYGTDLYGVPRLSDLVSEIAKIDGVEKIRLLYCYPESITDELIEVIANEEKVCKYIDIPLQHCNGEVLKRMNRKGDKESLLALIKKMREKIPGLVLRTTFITGFPGETEEQFTELCEFINEVKFDRLGCFAYSPEEDTPAAKMDGQLDEDIKNKRAETIMNEQMLIMDEKQQKLIGTYLDVTVDYFDEDNLLYMGRSYMDAPEIDTNVIISSEEELAPGQTVKCKVIGFDDFDMVVENAKC